MIVRVFLAGADQNLSLNMTSKTDGRTTIRVENFRNALTIIVLKSISIMGTSTTLRQTVPHSSHVRRACFILELIHSGWKTTPRSFPLPRKDVSPTCSPKAQQMSLPGCSFAEPRVGAPPNVADAAILSHYQPE